MDTDGSITPLSNRFFFRFVLLCFRFEFAVHFYYLFSCIDLERIEFFHSVDSQEMHMFLCAFVWFEAYFDCCAIEQMKW